LKVGEVVVVDDRGRVLIPSSLRRLLNLKAGSKLKVRFTGGCIILEPMLPEVLKVKAGRRWGEEAFLDAGEATFGN